MSTTQDASWNKCLDIFKQNVSEQQYHAYFEPIVFRSYDSNTQTVLVQVDRYVYEWLEEYHVDLLNTTLSEVFGKDVKLNYRLSGTGKREKEIPSDPPVQITNGAEQSVSKSKKTSRNTLPPLDPQLDLRLTFKNFIEGDSNKLSRSIGLSIAEHPQGSQFNPFFLYGTSGSGKTHLVNAMGIHTKQLYPSMRVLYVSARQFEVQYTNAVLQNKVNDFIAFYQTIDFLIIDDIQEWEEKKKTQDTFFHIFNHLFRNGRRMVLVSDRPPIEMNGMNERLLTRFSCGLIAEMEKPNVQLCIDILKNKIHRDGLNIPDDVVTYIAQTANGNIRDLHGVLNSLMAYSVVYNCSINMKLAERVIKRAVKVDNVPLTIDDILESVCSHYDVKPSEVRGKSRKKDYVVARQVTMYLAQRYTKMPTSRIGKLIGDRDHSTVIYSCAQIEKRIKIDKAFAEDIESIETSFQLKRQA